MPIDGTDGNKLNCARGGADEPRQPKPPKESKDKEKLVRIGSRYFSKDTHTKRKFNIGFCIEKAPGGVAFKTQNHGSAAYF